MLANPRPAVCPVCGGVKLEKQVSRFSRVRTEDDALEALTDESVYGDLEENPAAMRKWMQDMSVAMDEDMDEDIEQALEEEFAGQPNSIDRRAKDETVY